MDTRGTVRVVSVAVAVAAAAILGMGIMMAAAMGGTMDGHMGGSGGGAQASAVFTARDVAIEISDFDYAPRDATVPVGAKVTWTNRDGAPHSATDVDGDWDTGLFKKGESRAVVFDAPGTYTYYCTIHPQMTASLTVN